MNTTNNPMAQNMTGMPMNGMQQQQQMPQGQYQQAQMHNMQMMQMMPGTQGQMAQQPMMQGQMNQFNPNQMALNAQKKQDDSINQKYKTERCRHYETHKNCILREKCHFAHGDEELRKPGDPLTPEQLALALKSVQYQNCNQTPGKQKKIGDRPGKPPGMMGGKGQFPPNGKGMAYGNQQMGPNVRGGFQNTRGNFNNGMVQQNRQSIGGGMNKPQQQQQPQKQNFQNIPNPVPTANYKTVKCRHFEKRGVCKYGDKCSYAHGDADLRSAQQNSTGKPMGQMRNNQMPQPNPQMDGFQNMNQFQGMMMPNQMTFPGQGIYMDPNSMNMQMMFNTQAQSNDPQNQQYHQGMMPNNFMHMQNLMGMQAMQAYNNVGNPTLVHFKNVEKLQDGTSQQVNRSMTISPMEQSVDVQSRIKEICGLLQSNQNESAFQQLTQLRDEGKVQFQINKENEQQQKWNDMPKTVGVENAEQQVTQAK